MKKLLLPLTLLLIISMLAGCTVKNEEVTPVTEPVVESTPTSDDSTSTVVNLYTDRHYDTDEELYKKFTETTGITVNVVKGKSDELIERLSREGEDTEADLLIAADAGRLFRAKDSGLLQALDSELINQNVPSNFRDVENQWVALTLRARVLVYALDRVNPEDIKSYEELTEEKWNGKVLARSSANIYNQSLLASFIAINGEESARQWAEGVLNNMAREPQGNDRDQATAVVAGEGDIAIMNTYYVGKMLNSENPEEVKVAENIGVFFPNQETTGTHVNISGVGLAKHSKNKTNAIKLVEFLTSEEAQSSYAEANYEYPVNQNVEASDLLKSWGDFKAQDINLSVLGANNQKAVEIFNEVGWQ